MMMVMDRMDLCSPNQSASRPQVLRSPLNVKPVRLEGRLGRNWGDGHVHMSIHVHSCSYKWGFPNDDGMTIIHMLLIQVCGIIAGARWNTRKVCCFWQTKNCNGTMVINCNTQREIGWFWLIRLYHVHMINMAMDQYLYIPFLVGWTSIYQLFWCSPGVQGFDTLPYHPKIIQESPQLSNIHPKITQQSSNSHANFLRKIIPTKISNIILHK